jgi:hypothetical protein
MRITGQCHCGFVTYEAEIDPSQVSICHCTDCQRLTGSAYRVSASAPSDQFQITRGRPKLYVKIGDTGAKRLQFFCGDCGSPLYTTGEGADAQEVGLRLGTIDQRLHLRPTQQKWCRSALAWVNEIGDLPGQETD